MIISVEDFEKFVKTEESDEVLSAKLAALELLIRKYTNNNFQKRSIRTKCPVIAGKLYTEFEMLSANNTVQISESIFNDGLYTIDSIEDQYIMLNEMLIDESGVLVTKIEYPIDLKMGVVNMMKWDLDNRDKVGIQSETISRHSVTYFNMDGDNSMLGYPKSLCGFLKPYMKARF